MNAIVLFSGGLDSTTVLYHARREGYRVHALSFDYGQRHRDELFAAVEIARRAGVEHTVLPLRFGRALPSALTDISIKVPHDRDPSEMEKGGIPSTYVPARNTLFLSYALAWAEICDAPNIFLGVNAVDYSGYPDCRPAFVEAFQRVAEIATRTPVRLHTPLLALGKREIVAMAQELDVPLAETVSCYMSSAGVACGRCDACALRLKGFEGAGLTDPIRYA